MDKYVCGCILGALAGAIIIAVAAMVTDHDGTLISSCIGILSGAMGAMGGFILGKRGGK